MHAKSKALPLLVVALVAAVVFPPAAFADDGGLSAGGANLIVQAASDHTADDAINWAKGKVGTPVGYDDGSGYYQCVEFIQAYYEYLGVSPVSGNGCDYAWNALPAGWTRTAGGQPQKGDILVYGAYGSQAYGHVAIYESDNSLYDQDGSVWGATVKHEAANYRTYTWAYWGCIHPDFGSPVNHNPVMAFDGVSVSDGEVHVTGWAYDPDVVSQSTDVHVYLFQNGNPTCIGGATANISRKDVDNAFHVGEFHGFDATFETGLRGTVDVQIAAINVGEGVTVWSDKKSITVLEPKGNAVEIVEDAYTIRSALDTAKALGVANMSLDNVANVMLHSWNGGDNQVFSMKPAGDGSYYIIARHSNKAVEVTNAYTNSGANVAQYAQNQSVAQRWFFDKNSDGTYTMRQRNSGMAMDVTDAKTANGTNIQQCTRNGSDAQKFYLVPVDVAQWDISVASANQTYTGEACAPSVTVNAGGVAMESGVDYAIDYMNNVNAGTATVTVTGIGAYAGSKSATFTIAPAAITSVEVAQPSVVYDGAAKTPELTVRAGSLVVPESGYDVVWSNDADTGAVTFAVVGKGNYMGRSNEIPVTVHVDSSSLGEADSPGAGASSGESGSLGDSDLSSGGSESPSGGQAVNPAAPTQAMHRLYNPNSGEHFYTADEGEYESVVAAGWRDEGIGWTAPAESETPVFRMYNPNAGEHHYTTSAEERDGLVAAGWKYEGIGWYSDDAQAVPLYRDYNPNAFANNHNYTTSREEHEWLLSLGWRDEGYAWYGV